MIEASATSCDRAQSARRRAVPAIRFSVVVHAAGALVLVAHPESWIWVVAALGCNYAALVGAVLYPRGRWLGPNMTALPDAAARRGEICLTFDDGPHPEITPRVLDLLERHGATASFFCVAQTAAAHPRITEEIVRRGHSVENHSLRHSHAFAFYGSGELDREVQAAQAAIEGITGRAPQFFRAPAGFRSPLLDPVLAARGLRYVSWTRRGFDTTASDPARVLRRLTRGLKPGDVLLLHDRVPLVLEVLPALLELLDTNGWKAVSLPAGCEDEPAA
jgi:peptidoglycan/xylan/chitin deacetylase (PgdA/CDA1 family)